ncbi:hypothetical protein Tco_1491312 [Tanacetum coccineum]
MVARWEDGGTWELNGLAVVEVNGGLSHIRPGGRGERESRRKRVRLVRNVRGELCSEWDNGKVDRVRARIRMGSGVGTKSGNSHGGAWTWGPVEWSGLRCEAMGAWRGVTWCWDGLGGFLPLLRRCAVVA